MATPLETARWYLRVGDTRGAIRALHHPGVEGDRDYFEALAVLATEIRERAPTQEEREQCDALIDDAHASIARLSEPPASFSVGTPEPRSPESALADARPRPFESTLRVSVPGVGRAAAIESAAKVWTGQLVDLTARNNLLYFRDLKVGTLDLGDVRPDLVTGLLGGRSIHLSWMFPDPDAKAAAVKRARAVRNRAQEHFEERGLETLFLACGMATWTNPRSAATPAAPVLLMPARLAPRGAAQDEFELAVTGELEVNPTLLQMLQTEFDCHCDAEELLSQAGIDGAVDTLDELEMAYHWLAEKCAEVPGFDVTPRFVLGTFSYAKLPMVKDIEHALEAMVEHDLIAALAGDDAARAAVRDRRADVDPKSPDHTPPVDEFLVLDADASQNYAINAVLAGQDLIVKGPPGTGKSQTITNLVSTLVARGKRVLFVAEKRAAIDAVLKRLEDVGLGDLVLDLHGGVGSRRKVAESLAAALSANTRLARPNYDAEQRLLQARRDELNEHVEALHMVRDPWQLSYFQAQSRLLGLDPTAATVVRFRGIALSSLDEQAMEAAADHLRVYAGLGGLTLSSSGSPWAKAEVTSAKQANDVQALVARLRHHTLPVVLERLGVAAGQTRIQPPGTIGGWGRVLALWADVDKTMQTFQAEVFEVPLPELLAALAPLGQGLGNRAAARVSSSAYRQARKQLKTLVRPNAQWPRAPELLAQLDGAADELRTWRSTAANASRPSVPEDLGELESSFEQLQTELTELASVLKVERLDDPVENLQRHLDALLADTATLGKLPELDRRRKALGQMGLQELLADLEKRGLSPEPAAIALRHAWLSSIVEHIQLNDVRIGAFDGEQHSRTVAEFQDADRRHIETTAHRVRRLCAEQATHIQDQQPDQAALIRDQAARKRKHLSLRQLFSAAPDVMTALKPCWAMSPLVVSQLLPSDKQYFDVVVFDEASQVKPADAIPAILRGKRVVVAGDERQLPPTDFFTGANADIDTPPELEGRIILDAGYESILDALLPFIDFRMLAWHYRSRDERLIAFSNVHLYDRGLTTFPGVGSGDSVGHVLVPFMPGEPGSDESAAAEVRRVVELIFEHAEKRPEESLGVIAMGIKHSDRIQETLRRALLERPGLEGFFDEARPEKFFVKNLERVQGDERDAIILSVGYGKNPDGRLLYRFGPLNTEGGERRLNVAITRAKNRMTLVSAFAHADMDPDRSTKLGVELLRLYLQYAHTRGQELGERALAIPELNPFEVDVRDALERVGIPLSPQYGSSGFRIDFAAKHPVQPGRLVLAIECDGASYHSSETARDRDRLRQEHLQRLGWRFHRIWSQDWFTNKERETQRALAAYNAAVMAADKSDNDREATAAAISDEPTSRASATVSADGASWPLGTAELLPTRGPRPAIYRGRPITEYSQSQLRAIVRWIESDTLLRTRDELTDEVMRELGFSRHGNRIVDAIKRAIAAERRG
jgi:very-short-patch-repair endonuclease